MSACKESTVVSDSMRIVDSAIGRVNYVLNLPDGLMNVQTTEEL